MQNPLTYKQKVITKKVMEEKLSDRVYRLLKSVPSGKVTTYKLLAEAARTRGYRAVGQILRNNPYAPTVPCHRVVSSSGSIGGFRGNKEGKDITDKISILESEGIKFDGNKIKEFNKKLYRFDG